MTTVIGVDPGVSGAVAFVDHTGSCVVEDLPTMPSGRNGLVKRKLEGEAVRPDSRAHQSAGVDLVRDRGRADHGR
jgi:hypothetical protein